MQAVLTERNLGEELVVFKLNDHCQSRCARHHGLQEIAQWQHMCRTTMRKWWCVVHDEVELVQHMLRSQYQYNMLPFYVQILWNV